MSPNPEAVPLRRCRKESFLRPAVLLMDRLRYPQKFALISLLFALPLGLALYSFLSEITDRIEFSRKEVHGDAYLRPLRRLMDRLSAYGADADAAAVEAEFKSLEAADRRPGPVLRSSERFQLLRERRQELKYGVERGRTAEVPALRARVLADLRGREVKAFPALVYSGRELSGASLKGVAAALHKARSSDEELLETVKALLKNPVFAPREAACTAA
jgi:hypothetical protein